MLWWRKETCIKLFGVECYAQTEEFVLGLKNIYENKSKEEKQKIKNSIINNNYNFIMILNKNYEEFEHIINE